MIFNYDILDSYLPEYKDRIINVENELRQNVNILPILRPRRSQPDGKFQALLDLLRTSTHKANQSIIESAVKKHDDTSEVIVHQKTKE